MDEIAEMLDKKPEPECKTCKIFSAGVLCGASGYLAAINLPEVFEKQEKQLQVYNPRQGYQVKSSYSTFISKRGIAGLNAFLVAPFILFVGLNSYFKFCEIDFEYIENKITNFAKERANERFTN